MVQKNLQTAGWVLGKRRWRPSVYLKLNLNCAILLKPNFRGFRQCIELSLHGLKFDLYFCYISYHMRLSAFLCLSLLLSSCSTATPAPAPTPVELPSVDSVDSELSTLLNDRFETNEDPYCLSLDDVDWTEIDSFLEDQFGDGAEMMSASVHASMAENSERRVTSMCRYAEELYVAELQGSGEEFQGYRVYTVSGADSQFEIGSFMVPYGRVVELSTVLFDDSLGMSARSGGPDYTSWYYYRVGMDANSIEQVEWCDRDWNASTLDCEYTYSLSGGIE